MVKKQLDQEQKNQLRDQVDGFKTQLFGEGEKLSVFQYQEQHYLSYIKIQIKQTLKKILLLKDNIKALQSQIRDGVEVQDPKTQLNNKEEEKMSEDEEKKEDESEKSEDKSEESSDEEKKEE